MKSQKGFTLIETLIAIFLLTLTIGGMLELVAGGFFSVRYARNQLVATTLLQESLEYVHNSRDTAAQQGISWETWVNGLKPGCFENNGCMVDAHALSNNVVGCGSACLPVSYFPTSGLYGYAGGNYPAINGQGVGTPTSTTYVRSITMQQTDPDQLIVTARVTWKNGGASKVVSQSVLLTKWK